VDIRYDAQSLKLTFHRQRTGSITKVSRAGQGQVAQERTWRDLQRLEPPPDDIVVRSLEPTNNLVGLSHSSYQSRMRTVMESCKRERAASKVLGGESPSCIRTNLHELIAVLQDELGEDNDLLVVSIVVHLLRSGRLKRPKRAEGR
jgi:hypothetical protein